MTDPTAGERLRMLRWEAADAKRLSAVEFEVIVAAGEGANLPAWVAMLRRTADALEALHKENEAAQ